MQGAWSSCNKRLGCQKNVFHFFYLIGHCAIRRAHFQIREANLEFLLAEIFYKEITNRT